VRVSAAAKSFGGVAAVQDVSFDLHYGEVVALAGENGAGKTAIKNLLGITKPDAGSIEMAGEDLGADAGQARRLGVAAVHQELTPFPSMTVAENVCITHLSADGGLVSRGRLGEIVAPLLERVGADFGPWEEVEGLSTARRCATRDALSSSIIARWGVWVFLRMFAQFVCCMANIATRGPVTLLDHTGPVRAKPELLDLVPCEDVGTYGVDHTHATGEGAHARLRHARQHKCTARDADRAPSNGPQRTVRTDACDRNHQQDQAP
jgi:ABC-type Fe3+/spermidine/putrescine transport system ATPase subunit